MKVLILLQEIMRMVESKRGDFVVIYSCGAYAESMSSNYNLRDNIKSYYSDTI